MLVALGNLTARSHAFHPDGSTNRSITQPATRLEVMEADMSTALLHGVGLMLQPIALPRVWSSGWWRRYCVSDGGGCARGVKQQQDSSGKHTGYQMLLTWPLALAKLLGCPCSLTILILLAILLPTLLQLYLTFERLLAGGELFDLEIASLRTVTGTLTDRQDAFTLLSAPIDGTLSSLATSPPSSPPPPLLDRQLSTASSTRGIEIYYTVTGGRSMNDVSGNVLTLERLTQLRDTEAAVMELTGAALVGVSSLIPCFYNITSLPVGQSPSGEPTERTIQACLEAVVASTDDAKQHFSSDFTSRFVDGDASCAALRTRLTIDDTLIDYTYWIGALNRLNNGESGIEVSWYGGAFLFWRSLTSPTTRCLFCNLPAAAILCIMVFALRLPLFAVFSLLSSSLPSLSRLCCTRDHSATRSFPSSR